MIETVSISGTANNQSAVTGAMDRNTSARPPRRRLNPRKARIAALSNPNTAMSHALPPDQAMIPRAMLAITVYHVHRIDHPDGGKNRNRDRK